MVAEARSRPEPVDPPLSLVGAGSVPTGRVRLQEVDGDGAHRRSAPGGGGRGRFRGPPSASLVVDRCRWSGLRLDSSTLGVMCFGGDRALDRTHPAPVRLPAPRRRPHLHRTPGVRDVGSVGVAAGRGASAESQRVALPPTDLAGPGGRGSPGDPGRGPAGLPRYRRCQPSLVQGACRGGVGAAGRRNPRDRAQGGARGLRGLR
jgi:hypothetical protein